MGQCSLFDLGEPVCPGAGVRRPEPHPGCGWARSAWVEFESNWLAGSDSLFDHLLDSFPGGANVAPCTTASSTSPAWSPSTRRASCFPFRCSEEVGRAVRELPGRRAGPLRTVGVCLYRTGRDSVAWHGDTIGRESGDDTLVAIVSLGEPRRFLLATEGRWALPPVQPRPRRPVGDGGQLPAHV